MSKYFYQPVWIEFTGFGDVPDYVGQKTSRRVFNTYEEAKIYAKKYCPKGYYDNIRKLKLSKNINKNT